MAVVIDCLRQEIQVGAQIFPVFVGFAPAAAILQVAEVPRFEATTPHQEIAQEVQRPPVQRWQRPIDDVRIARIAQTFDGSTKLMPNPVLLGENVATTTQHASVQQRTVGNGLPVGIFEVEIPIPDVGQSKPLWILDGQHRIHGLAKSNQSGDPIPLVLLLNQEVGGYTPQALATIFAQVTTAAEPLDELHNEWLTYAFNLGKYADSPDQRAAMESVATLCDTAELRGSPNPFFDRVRFNHFDETPVLGAVGGGFDYNCKQMQELVFRQYYSQSAAAGHISPADLAAQIAAAYRDLRRAVSTPPDRSVFFGKPGRAQVILQDGFLCGVLAALRKYGVCPDWLAIFRALGFANCDWDFSSWVIGLGGKANTDSAKIARAVFTEVLVARALPTRPSGQPVPIDRWFRGEGAALNVRFAPLTPGGRVGRTGHTEETLNLGYDKDLGDISPRRHIKVVASTSNVARVRLFDEDASAPGEPVEYVGVDRTGLTLVTGTHANPFRGRFMAATYGDRTKGAQLVIRW